MLTTVGTPIPTINILCDLDSKANRLRALNKYVTTYAHVGLAQKFEKNSMHAGVISLAHLGLLYTSEQIVIKELTPTPSLHFSKFQRF